MKRRRPRKAGLARSLHYLDYYNTHPGHLILRDFNCPKYKGRMAEFVRKLAKEES